MTPLLFLALQLLVLGFAFQMVKKADKTLPGRLSWMWVIGVFSLWSCTVAFKNFALASEMAVEVATALSNGLGILLLGLTVHALLVAMRARTLSSVYYWVLQSILIVGAFLGLSLVKTTLSPSILWGGLSTDSALATIALAAVLSLSLYGVQALVKSYQESDNEFLRFRGRWFLKTNLVLHCLLLLFWLSFPGFAQVAHASELMSLGVVVVGSVALQDAPKLYLFQTVREMISHSKHNEDELIADLSQFIGRVDEILSSAQGGSLNRLAYRHDAGRFLLEDSSAGKRSTKASTEIVQGWIDGSKTSIQELEESNERLSVRLRHVERELERRLSDASTPSALEERQSKVDIAEDISSNFGAIASPELAMEAILKTHHALFFLEAEDSQDLSLVKRLHSVHSDKPLKVISAKTITASSEIQEIFSGNSSEGFGLAILDFESLRTEVVAGILGILDTVAAQGNYIYLSVSEDFLSHSTSIDYYSHYRLRKIASPGVASFQHTRRAQVLRVLRANHHSLDDAANSLDMTAVELAAELRSLGIRQSELSVRGSFASFRTSV